MVANCGVGEQMIFQMALYVWEFMLDIVSIAGMGSDEKDLEMLLLRQQLRIVERKHERGPQIPRWQKVPLAMLAMRLQKQTRNGKVKQDSLQSFLMK